MSKKNENEKELNDKHQVAEAEKKQEKKEAKKKGKQKAKGDEDGLDKDQEKDKELEKVKAELEESKDKFLRLYSEFENYRRRTSKERLDIINTATEDLMQALLPVIDDFERADKAFDENGDVKSLKEGYDLIHNKLKNILDQKGLKPMDHEKGDDFNPEYHDAITQIPVEEKDLKGKIVDVIEKGYFLNDKVIRFAKVVTGS